jgi:hypothetical protein
MAEPALREGRDYHVEDGLFVFTAHYLRARGFCCQSGCRHCPYGFAKPPPPPGPPPQPAEEGGTAP